MRGRNFLWLKRICPFFFSFCLAALPVHSQRMVVAPDAPAVSPAALDSNPQPENPSQILKVYPDGTKKIVPLGSLNQPDYVGPYGGPPRLSLYQGTSPAPVLSTQSPERLMIAPVGSAEAPASLNATPPPSPDPIAGASSMMAAADPMGGGSAAAVDPLSGAPAQAAPPLQTVSGKPAPIVGDVSTVELGAWDSFYLNAGIGGSLQGQLTARRVDNGTNRQAYPYEYESGALNGAIVGGENFTFNPGFRLDVEFGYNFYEWLGVGLQTGLTYNGINQYNLTLNNTVTKNGQTFNPGSYHFSADGELVQVPVQISAILRWPGQIKLRPFVGGGIGAVWQQLDVNNYYAGPLDIQGNYCRSAFQFGWNAQAGLTYTVEPGLDFYGAFKMLSAFMPVIGNYQFSNTYNFAVEVGVQSRF